jgi:eukaryotic-like serine/threonine-protein kinase
MVSSCSKMRERMPDPQSSPKPDPDLSGRTVGEFQLVRKLGQGGMGQVYLARQLSLKRDVAVKILRADHAQNATALQRFRAEAEAIARISHPNIVQVFAIGEHEGLNYMALEYVAGRNLREYLDRKGVPDLAVCLAILRQVAAALQRASEIGLVHRDIKPENILLNRKAEVKVADFGLSRYFAGTQQPLSLTQSGMTMGTPLYMSPEQVQGKPVDHRSDLYSLGVTAYHLLSGHPPFQGDNIFDVAIQHVQRDPDPLALVRPDLPPELCDIVHQLLMKQPDDRYSSAKDVLRDLARVPLSVLDSATRDRPSLEVTVPSQPALSASLPAAPLPASARWPWMVGLGVLLVGFGFLGWWLGTYWRNRSDTSAVANGLGMADLRLPNKIVTSRERALLDQWHKPGIPREQLQAGIDLGILYLKEHRLEEAEKLFVEMESLPLRPQLTDPQKSIPLPASVVGKLGRCMVLAHHDQAKESIQLLESVLQGTARTQLRTGMEKLCFEFGEFGQMLSAAINRNVENLPKDTKLSPLVEWLRSPSSLLRGPK